MKAGPAQTGRALIAAIEKLTPEQKKTARGQLDATFKKWADERLLSMPCDRSAK
jgi:hypothetical protein